MADDAKKSATESLVASVLQKASTAAAAPSGPPDTGVAPAVQGAEPGLADSAAPVLPAGDGPTNGADAQALVGSVLDKLGLGSAPEGESPTSAEATDTGTDEAGAAATAPADSEDDAATLIEVYFDLEEPEERDALFDRLVALKSPLVTNFLRAMMEEDEDDYVRAAAAAELAKRGVDKAIGHLEDDLADPQEPFFFEHAIAVLSEVRGVGFYDTLSQIWHDPERDGDQRREAMLGMEALDLERAMADFTQMVADQHDIETLPDDQLEVAIMAFVRHGHTEAVAALEGLQERIRAAENIDADERTELAAFVGEGIDLLTT